MRDESPFCAFRRNLLPHNCFKLKIYAKLSTLSFFLFCHLWQRQGGSEWRKEKVGERWYIKGNCECGWYWDIPIFYLFHRTLNLMLVNIPFLLLQKFLFFHFFFYPPDNVSKDGTNIFLDMLVGSLVIFFNLYWCIYSTPFLSCLLWYVLLLPLSRYLIFFQLPFFLSKAIPMLRWMASLAKGYHLLNVIILCLANNDVYLWECIYEILFGASTVSMLHENVSIFYLNILSHWILKW